MTLLDSTVLIDALRESPPVVARLRERGGLFMTSAIAVDQILFGVRAGEEDRTHNLIAGLEVVPIGIEEAALAATWRREFARRGVTLQQSDCLIAACAVTHGVPLATANVKDFPMEGLIVEHWPSEG